MKNITILIMGIFMLLVVGGASAGDTWSFYGGVSAGGVNDKLSCSGGCSGLKIDKENSEVGVTFGVYFKRLPIDLGAEVFANNNSSGFLVNVRKRLGNTWAIEAGAGRVRGSLTGSFSVPAIYDPSINPDAVNVQRGFGTEDHSLYMLGFTRVMNTFDKKNKGVLSVRWMRSDQDFQTALIATADREHEPMLIIKSANIDRTRDYLLIGYRFEF